MDEVYAEMIKNSNLKKEYEILEEKYKKLFAEKSEIQYELATCKAGIMQMQTQDAEVRALHQSIRRLKHDMKNHLMVIGSYLNAKEYEEAKSYTSEILDKLNKLDDSKNKLSSLIKNNSILEKVEDYKIRINQINKSIGEQNNVINKTQNIELMKKETNYSVEE